MPARSTVDQLPPDIREEFEKRLIEKGFCDYSGLAAWLQERGFNISRSAAHRAGQKAQERFEQQLNAIRIATAQAKAISEAAEGEENLMGTALTRLCQEKTYQLLQELQETEEVKLPTLVRMVGDLNRSEIEQKRWIREMKSKLSETLSVAKEKEEMTKEELISHLKQTYGL